MNLLEIAAFHPDVMLHFRGTPLICEIMPSYYAALIVHVDTPQMILKMPRITHKEDLALC